MNKNRFKIHEKISNTLAIASLQHSRKLLLSVSLRNQAKANLLSDKTTVKIYSLTWSSAPTRHNVEFRVKAMNYGWGTIGSFFGDGGDQPTQNTDKAIGQRTMTTRYSRFEECSLLIGHGFSISGAQREHAPIIEGHQSAVSSLPLTGRWLNACGFEQLFCDSGSAL